MKGYGYHYPMPSSPALASSSSASSPVDSTEELFGQNEQLEMKFEGVHALIGERRIQGDLYVTPYRLVFLMSNPAEEIILTVRE